MCILFSGICLCLCMLARVRTRARVCACVAQMNVRSPTLALRFRPNVSAGKTTGCCLLSTAITPVHLTSDLCHADKNKIKLEENAKA